MFLLWVDSAHRTKETTGRDKFAVRERFGFAQEVNGSGDSQGERRQAMISVDHKWLQKTALSGVFLVLPAIVMICLTWLRRSGIGEVKASAWYPKLASISVIVLFLASIPNILFNISVGYMITWPAFGIVLVAFALGLVAIAPKQDRILLVGADLLLMVLCLISIVLPN
ncbi:MAG TPA: hypothetical protein VGT04_13340 [Acidobacteriaceae bacterium]|nr:hypothetical protein [Acidobacteriaceae bacterium]